MKINNRKLIVIHNLMNITNVDGIKKYIEDILYKSLTFTIITKKQMSNFAKGKINDTNKYIYIQKTDEIDKLEIQHIIIGNDNEEEIKKEFNEPAFRYIKKEITVASQRKFDIIESFIQFVIKDSKNYLDGDDFKENSIYYDNKTSSIKLKNNNDPINLKGVFINSKGIHNFLSNNEPCYSTKIVINERGEVYIEIEFEMFGNLNENFKICKAFGQNQFIITISGKIEEIGNKNENYEGTLKFNEFYFQVIIDKFMILLKLIFLKKK